MRTILSQAADSPDILSELWKLSYSADRRTSVNSLWIMTHFPNYKLGTIRNLQNELINRLLEEKDSSKKRLFLQLLRRQSFNADSEDVLRLLEYCLSKINSEYESYAVRSNCIHISFLICRPYPDLLSELWQHLFLLDPRSVSPGLKSALQQTRNKIESVTEKMR